MTRCAIYVRVSSEEQVRNLSLETQRAACERYAAAQGWTVEAVFVEEGESAKTASRTEFEKLVAYCRSQRGRVSFVIVYSVSRFMRNTEQHLVLRGLLAGMGIQLRSATEPIEEGASGRLIETVLAAFAQFDNDAKAERTIVGMKAALERGRWTHVAPLGYRNARDTEGRATLEHDERAPLIRRAFELAVSGTTQRAILREVTADGLRTRKGRALSPQSLARILRNPIYAGRVRSGAWAIEARAAFAPIVDEPVWFAAQAALVSARPTEHARARPEFPLKHFVRCATDGRPLTGYFATGKTTRVAYYECPECRARAGKVALEDAFVELLNDLRPDPRVADMLRLEVLEAVAAEERQAATQAETLSRRIATARDRRMRLVEGYVIDRAIDRATYEAMLGKLDGELAELELGLAQATGERLDKAALVNYAARLLTHPGDRWRASNAEQRRALQALVFEDGVRWSSADGFVRTHLRYFSLNDLRENSEPDLVWRPTRSGVRTPWRRIECLRQLAPAA